MTRFKIGDVVSVDFERYQSTGVITDITGTRFKYYHVDWDKHVPWKEIGEESAVGETMRLVLSKEIITPETYQID